MEEALELARDKPLHAVVLLLLRNHGELTLTDIRYAISERMGEPAPLPRAARILSELAEMGLIQEKEEGWIEGRENRVALVYKLTERGARVAAELAEMIGLEPR